MSRRKLGTSRRSKGKYLAKDPETELNYEHEDFEESFKVKKALDTRQLAATQLEIQDKSTQDHEDGMSKMHDGTLLSESSSDFSAKKTSTDNPEHLKSLMPGTDNWETSQFLNKLEETDEPKHPESDEVKENLPETSNVCTLTDQQMKHQADTSIVHDAAKSESNEIDKADMFKQDGSFQDSHMLDDSQLSSDSFEPKAEITTEKSSTTEGVDNERGALFSPKEASPRDTGGDFASINKVDIENIYPKEVGLHAADQRNELDHAQYLEQTGNRTETGKTCTEQMYEGEVHEEDHAKQNVEQTVYHEDLFELDKSHFPLNSQPSGTNPFLTFRHEACQDSRSQSLSVDEQTNTRFGQTGSRKKFGSRRKIKGQVHLKETEEEVSERNENDQAPDKENAFKTSQEELNQDVNQDIILSKSHDSCMSLNTSNPFTDVQCFQPPQMQEILQTNEAVMHNASGNPFDHLNNQNEITNQLNPTVESTDKPTTKQETLTHVVKQNDFPATDLEADQQFEGWVLLEDDTASRETQLLEFNVLPEPQTTHLKDDKFDPAQIQEMLQSGNTPESFTEESLNRVEISTEIFSDQVENPNASQSEFTMENTDDSTTIQATPHVENKPDEYSPNQCISDTFDPNNENYKLHSVNEPEISNLESSARSQEYEIRDRHERSVEPNTEQTFDEESSHNETDKTKSLHSQSHDSSVSVDENCAATNFHNSSNRRKLGSSRKIKGKHTFKQFVTEENHETSLETDGIFAEEMGGQEKSLEIFQEEKEKSEDPQTAEPNFNAQSFESPSLNVISSVNKEILVNTELQRQDECRKEKESPEDELSILEEEFVPIRQAQQSTEIQSMSQTDYTSDKNRSDVYEQTEILDIKHSEFSTESGDHPKLQTSDEKRLENELDEVSAEAILNLSDEQISHKVSEGHLFETGDPVSSLQSLQHRTHDVWNSQKNDTNSGTVGWSGEKLAELELTKKDHLDTFCSDTTVVDEKQNEKFGALADNYESTVVNPLETLQLMSDSVKFADDKHLSIFSETECKEPHEECKEPHEDTEKLEPSENLQSNQWSSENEFFIPYEKTTEKSNQKKQTESHYNSEQQTVFSEENFSTNEKENDQLKSEKAFGALHSEDVLTSKPDELLNLAEVQPTQINDTIITEEESPQLTLQSDKDLTTMDLKPQESCQSSKGKHSTGDRRKLGSSRRTKKRTQANAFKASQESEEETENEKMLANTLNQEQLEDPISDYKVNTDNAVATSDVSPGSDNGDCLNFNKNFYEKPTKLVTEHDILSQFTGCETVNLMQSPQLCVEKDESNPQGVLHPDDIINFGSGIVHVLDQELAFQSQNTHNLSCDKDLQGQEIYLQQTGNVRCVTMEACNAEVENSMNVFHQEPRGLEQQEEKNLHTVQKKEGSQESKMDISAPLREKTPSEYNKNLEEKSKEKRRKMGSTRKTLLNKKQYEDVDSKENKEAENIDGDKLEIGEKLLLTGLQSEDSLPSPGISEQEETKKNKSIHHDESKLESSLLNNQSNERDVMTAFLHQQSFSTNPFLIAAEEHEKINVGELSQEDDFTNTETLSAPAATVMNSSAHLEHTEANTGISVQTHMDQVIAERVQDAEEQQPSSLFEESRCKNLETKTSSSDINSPKRRRKLGSTRKNFHTQAKEDGSNQKQELEENPTETITTWENMMKESSFGMQEKDLQHKGSDSEQREEKVFETEETSHVTESSAKSLAEPTAEESQVSQSFIPETENYLNPETESIPSSFPINEMQSESSGKRRKFGSNRKSRLHQINQTQTARESRMMDGLKENNDTEKDEPEEHRDESPGQVKRPEVDEPMKKAVSFNIPSEETKVQSKIHFDQDTRRSLSLVESGNCGLKTTSFNVVIIGESSVGKTSFMKRAQSGKFSLDLPASVGMDSCTWTVVVEGKSVVLKLWDTAGQERFRSITKQIFHKAQAFLLMYDISSSQSFSAVSYWANSIQESAAENVTVLLLGNKSDHERRQVKTEQGDILAKEYNYPFLECSAATGENVVQALQIVARMLSQRADLREEVTVLHKEAEQKKRSTCC